MKFFDEMNVKQMVLDILFAKDIKELRHIGKQWFVKSLGKFIAQIWV